jgi:hypothetical protein
MPDRSRWWRALVLGGACSERDRLTFPSEVPSDLKGPVTVITTPADDTVLTAGDRFVLAGQSTDVDGVDTVYFDVTGDGVTHPPLYGVGANTVDFGLPIPTTGKVGTTIVVRVHAVDIAGNQGDAVQRRLSVQ